MRWFALLLFLCTLPACATLTGVTITPYSPTVVRGAQLRFDMAPAGETADVWYRLTFTHETAGEVFETLYRNSPLYRWDTSQPRLVNGKWEPILYGSYTVTVEAKHASDRALIVEDSVVVQVVPPMGIAVDAMPGLAGKVATFTALPAYPTVGACVFEVHAGSKTGPLCPGLMASRDGRTVRWMPTESGTYWVQAHAVTREQGNIVGWLEFTVANPITITADPPSGACPGKRITLLATVTSIAVNQYAFEVKNAVGDVVYSRDWTSGRSTWWTSTAAGNYTVTASVRNGIAGTPITNTTTYTVVTPLTLAATPASPSFVGDRVVLTTTSAVPVNQYRFEVRNVADQVTYTRDWSLGRSTWWTPTAAGPYSVIAYARYGSTGDIHSTTTRHTVAWRISVDLAVLASTTPPRRTLIATPTAENLGGCEYRFEVEPTFAGGTAYTRDWTAGRSTYWTPADNGVYIVTAYVREPRTGRTGQQWARVTITNVPSK